ncbi:hypothetical protein DIPPA_70073 [Diplonema papillatum]|nr:hypothetical protein DIPPA_70073 [Diplonema papillatum]
MPPHECRFLVIAQLSLALAVVNGQTPTAAPGCSDFAEVNQRENFEGSFGGWFQDESDDVDWSRVSGGTPSEGTGPTSAYQGQYYVYVEATSPNYPSKRAILNSPCFDLVNAATAEFSFAYHMYSSVATEFGTMALEASTDEGLTWTSVWKESGSQVDSWHISTVDLLPYTGVVLRLRFNTVAGSSYTSDAAIDSVRLSVDGSGVPLTVVPSAAPPTVAPPTPAPEPWRGSYDESFESSFGAWFQEPDDEADWSRTSGETSTPNTGPKRAYDGLFYAYVEGSNTYVARAILNSPSFDLRNATPCFRSHTTCMEPQFWSVGA